MPQSLGVCRLHVHLAQALRSTAATGPVVGGSDDVVTAPRHRAQGTRQVPDLQSDRQEISLRNRVRMKFKIKNKLGQFAPIVFVYDVERITQPDHDQPERRPSIKWRPSFRRRSFFKRRTSFEQRPFLIGRPSLNRDRGMFTSS